MNGGLWDHMEEEKLTEFLVSRIRDTGSGRGEPECFRNCPRDVYFIGNLRPSHDEQSDLTVQPGHLSELINKLAPVAFGAEFQLQITDEPLEVSATLRWACYYRVFPTYEQQSEHQRQEVSGDNGESDVASTSEDDLSHGADEGEIVSTLQNEETMNEDQERESQVSERDTSEVADSTGDRRRGRTSQDSLFIHFRKIPCEVTGNIILHRNHEDRWLADASNLQDALDQELTRAQQLAMDDSERLRTMRNPETKVQVPAIALASKMAYLEFLHSLSVEVIPEWRWEVRGEMRTSEATDPAKLILSIEFINISPMSENSPNTEAFLFDTEAVFEFSGHEVQPFELDLAPKGFRYDRNLWGRGINCAIERQATVSTGYTFVTAHVPIYRQPRFITRTVPPARFVDLAQDPEPVLTAILQSMEEYKEIWQQERSRYISENPTWEIEHGSEFDRDRQSFEQDIARFRAGLELICSNPDVQLAFRLTNETFHRSPKEEWRLFQIVFLVIQIPGIAALSNPENSNATDREQVDIIYFPTGGGKTEAYLGIIVFHCFFDRLRGKTAGVTAWTRFPLRLLTLQQTQRVADVIGLAELVRREQQDSRLSSADVDGFAVGYFVGLGGSPNEISNPEGNRYATAEAQVLWSRINDPTARQVWKRVVRCPSCGTASINVDFVKAQMRLVHRCSRPDCLFAGGELPVYIVDNEIYRYLPCVMVGTIDKLAGLGNQRKFSLLFGQIDGSCSEHGYYKGKCCQKDCRDVDRLNRSIPRGLSGPTLFIQDELHLLKEGLGTFDGHYETFTQRLLQEFGHDLPLKIIASSATIEAFERQVNHLYGRHPSQARVFPGFGPALGESFYGETLNKPQRLYVGIIPHNKTIFNAILEIIELYHREVQTLQHLSAGTPNPYRGEITPGSSEWGKLLDNYATSLTYFSAKRQLDSIRNDLFGDVIPHLQRDGLLPFEISELTSGTSTDEVSRILEKLECNALPGSPHDAVLATSMVSHGVDVDRFNAMLFYGMPRQNAEYIQASSRVGRNHVGIVLTCLHPVRERDQSHYSYFIKYHEFLGQLVEPVAINRWSKFSISRSLPGLFMAVLLQVVANSSGESNPNRYYMIDFVRGKVSDGSLQPKDFIPLLEEAYGVQNATTPGEIAFREEIHLRVRQYLDWILSPSAGSSFVSDILIPKPMRSLRDVEEQIPIELDYVGSQWVSRAGRNLRS